MGKIEVPKDHPRYEELMRMDKARREQMAPAGGLQLPRLLDERRLDYGIPDGAFAAQAFAERVFIYQLSDIEGEKIGSIIMPDTVKDSERFTAPRGVLISAGFKALDTLKTNGVELGHIVWFAKNTAWKRRIAHIAGQWDYILPMNVGDVFGSEDLERMRRSREVRTIWNDELKEHQYVDAEGKAYSPESPWIGADS